MMEKMDMNSQQSFVDFILALIVLAVLGVLVLLWWGNQGKIDTNDEDLK
jgi:hypothetical protein